MCPGSSAGEEEVEKCNVALLEGRTQPHGPGESASHSDESPKGRGRSMETWAAATFPHPDLFWIQHRKLFREDRSSPSSSVFAHLPLLNACTGFMPTTQVML